MNSLYKKIIKHPNIVSFILYVLIYCLIFLKSIKGIGQYWDWSLPYYLDNFKNIFLNNYLSWRSQNFGSPLGYSSDYYLRLILSLSPFSPELTIYIMLVGIFALGSFFCFLLIKRYGSNSISFLVGLLVFLNPAIFSRVLAGYYLYLTSFLIFIATIFFLFEYFKNNLCNYLILALLFSFVGFQIQFFIFLSIFLAVFFLFNRSLFSLSRAIIMGLIVILVNSIWLMNFFVGATSILEFSLKAQGAAFEGAKNTSFLNVILLNFSSATLISKLDLGVTSLIFIGIPVLFIVSLAKQNNDNKLMIIAINCLVFLFLASGFYNKYPIFPLNLIYPMIRETGHFAAVVVFFLLVTIGQSQKGNTKKLMIYLSLLIIISIRIFIIYQPSLDYNQVRLLFDPYKAVLDNDISEIRVLSYPFFGRYSLIMMPTKTSADGYVMSNNGSDNFIVYSNTDSVSPSVPVAKFKSSLQYRFINNQYSIDELIPYNIKYIFDFSKVYKPTIEKYITSATYDNNIKNVSTDNNFASLLMKNGKSKLKKISENIYEIIDYMPRILAINSSFIRINQTKIEILVKGVSKKTPLMFLESYHKNWKLYMVNSKESLRCEKPIFFKKYFVRECLQKESLFEGEEFSYLWKKPIFDNTHKIAYNYANQWTIDPEYIKKNYSKEYYKENADGSIDVELTLYFKPQSYFYLGLIISGTTLLGCLGYLAFDFLRTRRATLTS